MAASERPRDRDWARLGVGWIGERARRAHAAWLEAGEEGEGGIRIQKRLRHARLHGLELSAVVGCGAWVEEVDFTATSMERARFVDCDFDDVIFLMARLADTSWDGCEFRRAMAGASYWDRARLTRCTFAGRGELARARWRGAILDEVDVVEMDARRAKFERTRFSRCTFRRADLREAVFEGIVLEGSNSLVFEHCDLRRVTWVDWPVSSNGLPEVEGVRCVDCLTGD